MKINYCLPIIKSRKEEVSSIITEHKNDYHYFEVWLDYIKDVDEIFVRELIATLGERLVILFRRKNLEPIQMDSEKRKEIIRWIAKQKCLLDLDITSQQEELHFIQRENLSLNKIVSYHNYTDTPEEEALKNIVEKIKGENATIIKLATYCNTEEDALRLLHVLTQLKKEKNRFIILGMGSHGIITRLFGTLWGNEMLFAPITSEEASAPGQMTKEKFEKIFEMLN